MTLKRWLAVLAIALGLGGLFTLSAHAAETGNFNSSGDSNIDGGAATSNFGSSTTAYVGVGLSTRRGLFLFQDPTQFALAPGASIKTASLRIYPDTLGGGTLVGAYQVLSTTPWTEGVVTWNKRASGKNWTTPGGDYIGTVLSSTPNNVTSGGLMIWDVLTAFNSWYANSGTANGILLRQVNEGLGDLLVLRTKEYGGGSQLPAIVFTYLKPVTSLTATAGGAGQISLGWTNPGTSAYYQGTLIVRKAGSAPTWTPTDGNGTGVYPVGYSPDGGATVVVFHDAALGTSFTDTGLTPGTTYYYEAFSRDSGNLYSLVSNTASAIPACAGVTGVSWIAAQAQSTQATVYQSSGAGSVMIIEKPTNAFVAGDYPTNASTWANNAAIGPNGAVVRYVGSATTSIARSGLTNNTTYYYQAFAYTGTGTATCYSSAAAATATARPSSTTQEAWSYMLAGGSALKPPIAGNDGIFFSSNAGQMISLNSTTGVQNWAPAATTSAVQGWLIPTPLSAGGNRVFAGDQGGKMYALNSSTGVIQWQPALTGATGIQAAPSVQVRAWSNNAFATAYPGTYDLVYVATKNGAGSTNNKVFALRSDTGAVVWTFNDGSGGNNWSVGEINGMPALDYQRNRLYVTSMSTSGTGASLWIVNVTTGQLVGNPGTCPTANSACVNLGDIDSAANISFDGSTLWVGNKTTSVYAINLAAAPGAGMMKWTAPLNLGANNQLKGLVWEDYGTSGRLYMVVANTTPASNAVRCFQDPGIGGTPNAGTPCSGWFGSATTISGAQASIPLDQLYVTSWDGTTGRIQQFDFATGNVGTAFTLGDGTKQPGDVSTDLGTELFVGTTEGKIFKISLPIPP